MCIKSVFLSGCKGSGEKGSISQYVQVYVLRRACPETSKPPLKQHRPLSSVASQFLLIPTGNCTLVRSGLEVEVEIRG